MLTRRLVWVAEDGERGIRGVLIAFAAHGFFFPVSVVGYKNERWILGLLRKAFRDAFDRGYHHYVTWLDGGSATEKKLLRLIVRRGARLQPKGWCGGPIAPLLSLKSDDGNCQPKEIELVG